MTRHELEELHSEINIEFAQRQRLGGYSADAGGILLLTKAVMIITRHLIEVDKEIVKLKRGVRFTKPKVK